MTQWFKDGLKDTNSSELLKAFFDKNINPGTAKTDPYGRDNMTAIVIEFLKKWVASMQYQIIII